MADARNNHPYRRPRDAATLILLDRSGSTPRVLMGRRHENSVFMPGKYVFPGGRVDRGDARLKVPDGLHPRVENKLLKAMKGKPSPARARGLALAAIRETAEETGLLIGRKQPGWSCVSPAWSPFIEHGVVPSLSPLTFFLRAITPPGRPRRFDTRFFCADAGSIAHQLPNENDELLNLHWLGFDEALKLDLPRVTRFALETLESLAGKGRVPKPGDDIIFFHERKGQFTQEIL